MILTCAGSSENQAIPDGAYFYRENDKGYKSRIGRRVAAPKKLLVTFGYKSNMKFFLFFSCTCII